MIVVVLGRLLAGWAIWRVLRRPRADREDVGSYERLMAQMPEDMRGPLVRELMRDAATELDLLRDRALYGDAFAFVDGEGRRHRIDPRSVQGVG